MVRRPCGRILPCDGQALRRTARHSATDGGHAFADLRDQLRLMATKLAVTIDRSGRLAGARIAGSSGHAVLDEEALAAARRAAPYPRPPQGVGGATVAIAVTLRFAPR